MHNTNPSQTSNNIYATARDAVNPDFAGLTNTEENQEFVMALEARILYARGAIRAAMGCHEEAEEMSQDAYGIADTLGSRAYRNGQDRLPDMLYVIPYLVYAWQDGYDQSADAEKYDY